MAEEIRQVIAQRIRAAREEQGITQHHLAELLGKSFKTVSNYETATYTPRTDELNQLAYILHKPVGYFYGEDGEDELSILVARLDPSFRKPVHDLLLRQLHRQNLAKANWINLVADEMFNLFSGNLEVEESVGEKGKRYVFKIQLQGINISFELTQPDQPVEILVDANSLIDFMAAFSFGHEITSKVFTDSNLTRMSAIDED